MLEIFTNKKVAAVIGKNTMDNKLLMLESDLMEQFGLSELLKLAEVMVFTNGMDKIIGLELQEERPI